ncbi:inorganic pyrophosphatase [Nitzschia inconspicua]|uniref:Inorganic pyrophosphatase n=1 Tax=Nitzschia inconspicua TaxID=303405 RepID=A0A9K3M005_9STRA|nr:inorganic pyrophosphatase [Nitzschia inconspicua]KAG7371570.1 inorganic pyrophosphatase [Nitzschia inconspicua]
MITEIPMYMTAKMEVNKDLPGNPIIQDIKDGQPRYYSFGTTFFNYGLIPQTWEDPEMKSILTRSNWDPNPSVYSLEDLERVKPGTLENLKYWLKRYETSDGKPEKSLASETPRNVAQAMRIVEEVHS